MNPLLGEHIDSFLLFDVSNTKTEIDIYYNFLFIVNSTTH